jgi:hypothetical protein
MMIDEVMENLLIEIYNEFAIIPVWVGVVVLVVAGSLIPAYCMPDEPPNGENGHYALPPKYPTTVLGWVWLVAQVLAVICTIVGFGLQIGIYFDVFPEQL